MDRVFKRLLSIKYLILLGSSIALAQCEFGTEPIPAGNVTSKGAN